MKSEKRLFSTKVLRGFCVASFFILHCSFFICEAQKFPERRIAREGNKLFEKEDMEGAGAKYGEALKMREDFTEATFNLGNVMLAEQKPDEAIELYKQILRRDPTDDDARWNLAYAQKMKEEQEQEQQQQQPQQDQDQQEQEQEQEQEQDKEQEQQRGGEQPQPQSQSQPPSGGISQQDAEAILEAMQAEEDRTQKEKEGEKVPAVGRSGKNW